LSSVLKSGRVARGLPRLVAWRPASGLGAGGNGFSAGEDAAPPGDDGLRAPGPEEVAQEAADAARAAGAESPEEDVSPAELVDRARREAAEIVNEAERRRQEIVEQARSEGYEVGKRAGYEEGLRRGEEEASTLVARARALLDAAAEAHEMLLRGSREQAARLAARVAEQIVGRELEAEPDLVLSLVDQAVTRLLSAGCTPTAIRVNPEDARLMERSGYAVAGGGVEVKADAALRRGDCVVESRGGNVEATVKGRVEEIERALVEEVRQDDD